MGNCSPGVWNYSPLPVSAEVGPFLNRRLPCRNVACFEPVVLADTLLFFRCCWLGFARIYSHAAMEKIASRCLGAPSLLFRRRRVIARVAFRNRFGYRFLQEAVSFRADRPVVSRTTLFRYNDKIFDLQAQNTM